MTPNTMKLSEVIKRLEEIKEAEGDLPIMIYDIQYGAKPVHLSDIVLRKSDATTVQIPERVQIYGYDFE